MKTSMKFIHLTFFVALALPLSGKADSLLEVYQQALQSDPLIHEADARRMAAAETAPQARGALFPQLNANANYGTSDAQGNQLIIDSTGVNSVPFTSESDAQGWDIGIRQTIFRWDQVVTLKQAHKIVAQAEADYEAAQQDLMIRVATQYFEVLSAEDVLTAVHADRLAIGRQLEQARQRFEVGLIAITDVQESRAAYDSSVANEISAKRSLAAAREALREITGEYADSLSAPEESFPLVSPNPETETSWVDLAMTQNLAVISSRLGEQVARDEISFRRTGHYPTLDLVAGRSYSESTGDSAFSTPGGIQSFPTESDRIGNSISLQLTVPIFSGGRVSSRVRQAVYLHRASQEQLQRVVRATERQTRDAYLGVLAEMSRVNALAKAVESSETALEATQAGFDVGTRTIVDVLRSQFLLYQAITDYYRSRYAYIGNVLLLKQAAGTLQVQDLEEIDRNLVDRRPPEEAIAAEEATGTEES